MLIPNTFMIYILFLILPCRSSEIVVGTLTSGTFTRRVGESFIAQCFINVTEGALQVIQLDDAWQLGVKMIDCQKNKNASHKIIAKHHLSNCVNIPTENVTCQIRSGTTDDRHYVLAVSIPGSQLSRAKNYSFSCYEINRNVRNGCPRDDFRVVVTDRMPSPAAWTAKAPSSINSAVTVTERVTPEIIQDHSTSGTTTIITSTPAGSTEVDQIDTENQVVGPKSSIGNSAVSIVFHPSKLSQLICFLLLVELLTRR